MFESKPVINTDVRKAEMGDEKEQQREGVSNERVSFEGWKARQVEEG